MQEILAVMGDVAGADALQRDRWLTRLPWMLHMKCRLRYSGGPVVAEIDHQPGVGVAAADIAVVRIAGSPGLSRRRPPSAM